jgi:hypothetical protein
MPPAHQAAPPAKRSRTVRAVLVAVIALVAFVSLGFFVVKGVLRGPLTDLQVGQCAVREGSDSIKKIDCADPTADFVVVGRKENVSEDDYNVDDPCGDYADSTSAYWAGPANDPSRATGILICVKDK